MPGLTKMKDYWCSLWLLILNSIIAQAKYIPSCMLTFNLLQVKNKDNFLYCIVVPLASPLNKWQNLDICIFGGDYMKSVSFTVYIKGLQEISGMCLQDTYMHTYIIKCKKIKIVAHIPLI